MRRAAEDRARAVIHQDEVGDVDRQLPARVEGMADGDAGVEALLLGRLQLLLRGAHAAAFGVEGGDLLVLALELLGQRMVGRDADEGCAEQRVGAGRVDLDPVMALGGVDGRERELEPARAADPVGLHRLDLGRPVVEPVQRLEQVLGEIRDAEEPLRQLAPLDQRARAPAAAVLDLLVGEHGHVDRVPVHHRVLAVDEALFEEVEKERLLLAVIVRIAGREHPAPVDREAERLHLLDHRFDVAVGPVLGVAAGGHRGVLGRHAEGVEAHRVQDVVPGRALVAGHDVTHRVVAHMADMDAPRRIGEHLEDVVLRLAVLPLRAEGQGLVPGLLPFRLDLGGRVARHGRSYRFVRISCQGRVIGRGRGRVQCLPAPDPLRVRVSFAFTRPQLPLNMASSCLFCAARFVGPAIFAESCHVYARCI